MTLTIPVITPQHVGVELVAALVGPTGAGGGAFQQAIQCCNARDVSGAVNAFEKALDRGLDPLRQGYAHASLGELNLKQGNLAGAVTHLATVLTFPQVLFESAHLAAQYLAVVLTEFGRQREADALQAIAARTSARLGYSLSASAAEEVRQLARASCIGR